MERNIYKIRKELFITSDEEIKERDWFYDLDTKYVKIKQSWENSHLDFNCKKIILTTDQDLIADGVQAIDDEFLEWFVKNPSCERVEVKKGFADGTAWGYNFLDYKIIIPQEEPKQETLEEVAEIILANNIDGLRDALKDDDLFFFYKGVIQCYGEAMANWQQEQDKNKYSEEDMKKYADYCIKLSNENRYYYPLRPEDWFEQFYKLKKD
jgi:hypothetical protein